MMYTELPQELQKIIDDVIKVEAGYVNHPNDPGGETNFGITKLVAQKYGYTGDMIDLPKQVARDIYSQNYIFHPKYNLIYDMCGYSLAQALIDAGVHSGTNRSSIWFQKCLNAFNLNQKIYPDLVEDGSIGSVTLSALQAYISHRGDEGIDVLLKALKALRGEYLILISRNNPKLEDFVYGWIKHRI